MLKKILQKQKYNPLVVSHRGCSVHENKLVGFTNGVHNGCNLLECDVRLSKDRSPVVIHDKRIDRTTHGKGLVKRMTKTELSGFGIPSFLELVEWCLQYQDVCLFVEIKDIGKKDNPELLYKVVSIIVEKQVVDRCIIISFDDFIVSQTKKMLPDILTGFLYGPLFLSCPFELYQQTHADCLLVHHSIIDSSFVERAKSTNTPLFAWTVNDEHDLRKINNMKIDGIITDFPCAAFQIQATSRVV